MFSPLQMSARFWNFKDMHKYILFFLLVPCIEPVQAQYHPIYTTTAHRLLKLEQQYDRGTPQSHRRNYDSMYQKLDALIDTVNVRLSAYLTIHPVPGKPEATYILSTIDSVLTEQYFLVCIPVDKLSDALSPKPLGSFRCNAWLTAYRRQFCKQHLDSRYYGIDCDMGAFLYLSIGEVLHLPIHFIEVPGHNFVRWQFADHTYINWDNNSAGIYTDNDFREGRSPTESKSFTKQEEIRNHFLQNMSQNDITGYYLGIIAAALSHEERYAETEQLYEQSLVYRPYDAISYNNLSWMYLTVAQFKNDSLYTKAYRLSVAADSLLPAEIEYRDTYSCACAAVGLFDKAVQIEKTARNKQKRLEGYQQKKTCLDMGETIW